MTTTQWIAVASLATVIVSALAIALGLKGVRDQMRVTVFLAYTERYAQIMRGMPAEAREPGSGFQLASLPTPERQRVLTVFREYLNMCSEELWLHEHQHVIDRPTWNNWKLGMYDAAQMPGFREAWNELADEYSAYKDFQDLVNHDVLPGPQAESP